MNARQRDAFLWQWSRKRAIGARGAALRGLLIGAAGGVLFAVLLQWLTRSEGRAGVDVWLAGLRQFGLVMALAVPAFGALGLALTWRIYASQERIYQALLDQGATLPAAAPVLGWADRGPALAVGVTMALLTGLIVAAFIAYG